MRKLLLISLASLITTLAGAAESFGQCNRDPFKPSILPPCPSIMDRLSQAADAAMDFNNKVAQLNNEIGDARTKYWKRYPDKPGYEEAELAFYKQLWTKDMYYLMFALPAGMNDRVTRQPNVMGLLNGSVSPEDLDKFPKNVDGGIRPYAFPMFANWVNALRRAEGREETKGEEGALATPFIIATAIKDRSNWRVAYEDARNWSEFLSSGLDISKYVTPKVYLHKQMEADVSWVLGRSKPAEIPDPIAATHELYELFVKMFGEKEVLAAADAVLRTPKNSIGGLAKRADVSIGTYGSSSPNPYMLFLSLVTNASPRNYAISLCMDQYGMLGGEATATFNTKTKWDGAFTCYNQLTTKYGEPNVVSAAAKLKGADKDGQGGLRADPQAKSVVYWFTVLLKDPKATIPDAQVPHFRASSFDPHWMGQILEVRGTVSKVDLAKGKFPPYATIHFKESRGDSLVAYTPNSDMWQEIYGDNFAGLIGKPVEIFGQVTKWDEHAGMRVINRDQVKVVDASALGASFTDSRPAWLTAPIVARTLPDSPKYLAWKKFPVGTTVSYETRLLHEYQPGLNQYTRNKISVITFRLDSIDDKRAVVMASSTVWHRTGGAPTQTPETKMIYPAKEDPAQSGEGTPNETGDETVEISGKKYTTHWKSVWGHAIASTTPDPETFTKTWTSEDVPGGLVLTHQQSHTQIVGKEYRDITETILMPVAGAEPELGSWSAHQVTPGAPAAQPAAPNRAAPPTAVPPTAPVQGTAKGAPTNPAMPQQVPAAPPVSRRVPTLPVQPTQALSPQAEFARHYNMVMARVNRAKIGLAQLQRRQAASGGAALPDDVQAARVQLDAQIQSVMAAMRARDNATAEQHLLETEETLKVIEQFLAK
jgi:hypothetical protein